MALDAKEDYIEQVGELKKHTVTRKKGGREYLMSDWKENKKTAQNKTEHMSDQER